MSDQDSANVFTSGLGKGKAAFLSEVVERALALGERTPEDFLAHFSCKEIMLALSDRPSERAAILCGAAKTHAKIAPKMSAEASGEALQIALDEDVTTPADIVALFKPDDRQCYLKDTELWEFAVEGEPQNASGPDLDRASNFISFMLERAIYNDLMSEQALVEALTVSKLTNTLPHEVLAAIIQGSLASQSKFSHRDLLKVATPSTLARHLPLDLIWEKVILGLVAEKSGYIASKADATSESKAAASTPTAPEETPAAAPVTMSEDKPAEPTESDSAAKMVDAGKDASSSGASSGDTKDKQGAPESLDSATAAELADLSHLDEVEEDEFVEAVDSDEGFEEILDEELSEPPPGPGVRQLSTTDSSDRKDGSGKAARKFGSR